MFFLEIKQIRSIRLDPKGVVLNDTLSKGVIQNQGTSRARKTQQVNFISEPNLYRVIFRSDKPEAKKFQDWVFAEVLPTIRKTGKYIKRNDPPLIDQIYERGSELKKLRTEIQLLTWLKDEHTFTRRWYREELQRKQEQVDVLMYENIDLRLKIRGLEKQIKELKGST